MIERTELKVECKTHGLQPIEVINSEGKIYCKACHKIYKKQIERVHIPHTLGTRIDKRILGSIITILILLAVLWVFA